MGAIIFVFGIPSATSGSGGVFASWSKIFGMSFFDTMDHVSVNWLLPIGGFFIALFVGWVMPDEARRTEFSAGSRVPFLYLPWLWTLRIVVPAAILVLWLFSVGILPSEWLR
jgi:NSS family neurotransmitter:Na+ symporter